MRKRMPFYDVYLQIKYYLHMSYTFKLKSSFGNQKCALKNIKSALFLFSAPCPFFSLRETLVIQINIIPHILLSTLHMQKHWKTRWNLSSWHLEVAYFAILASLSFIGILPLLVRLSPTCRVGKNPIQTGFFK